MKILLTHPTGWGLEEKKVLTAAVTVAKELGFDDKSEIGLMFVGRKKAKDLNVTYRQMTYTPQVLAFPMSKEVDVDGIIHWGDVIICTPLLKRETIFQKQSLDEVLLVWLKHGLENLKK